MQKRARVVLLLLLSFDPWSVLTLSTAPLLHVLSDVSGSNRLRLQALFHGSYFASPLPKSRRPCQKCRARTARVAQREVPTSTLSPRVKLDQLHTHTGFKQGLFIVIIIHILYCLSCIRSRAIPCTWFCPLIGLCSHQSLNWNDYFNIGQLTPVKRPLSYSSSLVWPLSLSLGR